MGPDLELQGKSKASMEVSVTKENAIPTEGPEDRLLQCSSNCEDNSFGTEALLVERSTELDASGNIEVNITDSINGTDAGLVESECQNASEHSSSFGDTESGTESGWMFAGDEVESHLCATNASLNDGCFDTLSTRYFLAWIIYRIYPLFLSL